VLVSIAAPLYLGRLGGFSVPVAVVGAIGALVMAFVFWTSWLPQVIPGGLFPPLEGVPAWLPYVFFGWTIIGLVWYLAFRARNPEKARLIGSRFETHG
jgi:hypothetical protein